MPVLPAKEVARFLNPELRLSDAGSAGKRGCQQFSVTGNLSCRPNRHPATSVLGFEFRFSVTGFESETQLSYNPRTDSNMRNCAHSESARMNLSYNPGQ